MLMLNAKSTYSFRVILVNLNPVSYFMFIESQSVMKFKFNQKVKHGNHGSLLGWKLFHRWHMHASHMTSSTYRFAVIILTLKLQYFHIFWVGFSIFLPFAWGLDSLSEGLSGRSAREEEELVKRHHLSLWYNDAPVSLLQTLGGGGGGDGGLAGSIVLHSCGRGAKEGTVL